MAVAADVPDLYDIVLNGQGYIFARQIDPNLPFRTQKAKYSYSPTFLERTNISGAWGDNQQAFWLTFTQSDWSGGEGLRFARPNDPQKENMYWLGDTVDNSVPGQISPKRVQQAITLAANAITAICATNAGWWVVTSTNLYLIDISGTITDKGAHGAGTPVTSGLVADGANVYISGATKLRKYNGAAFSDFSATTTGPICWHNNALYGISAGTLTQYDTVGTATTVGTIKKPDGTAITVSISKLVSMGGVLGILLGGNLGTLGLNSIWQYDGIGVSRLAGFPENFNPYDACITNELLLVTGSEVGINQVARTVVYYYANGNLGILYRDPSLLGSSTAQSYAICGYGTGFMFTDPPRGTVRFYDLITGSVSSVGSHTSAVLPAAMQSNSSGQVLVIRGGQTAQQIYSNASNLGTNCNVIHSLIDFDTSLLKYVKGVTVDFEALGGTVDIAYQLETLDGSWTALQTGATSGTEYAVNQSCRRIGVRVTLNGSAINEGKPVLKRLYVRAVPIQQSFRNDELILDCTGADKTINPAGNNPVVLNNGNPHPLTGTQQVTNLRTAAIATTPFSITDKWGTFTGVIEPAQTEFIEVRPGEFYARIVLREV